MFEWPMYVPWKVFLLISVGSSTSVENVEVMSSGAAIPLSRKGFPWAWRKFLRDFWFDTSSFERSLRASNYRPSDFSASFSAAKTSFILTSLSMTSLM